MAKPNDLIARESLGLCNSPKVPVTFSLRAEASCHQEKSGQLFQVSHKRSSGQIEAARHWPSDLAGKNRSLAKSASRSSSDLCIDILKL